MRKIYTLAAMLCITAGFSQAYDGYADNKASIGATFQDGATGIQAMFDRGINDWLSYGFSFGYVIQYDKLETTYIDPNTGFEIGTAIEDSDELMEKIDFNVRLNVHLTGLMELPESFDAYAGPNVGRNVGAQAGLRYLFTDGFGIYAEGNFPFVKNIISNDDDGNFYPFYEQPVIGVGIVISY